eukprot:TRINITY_DN3237_c0_g2_i1.p1 TRINITY_DN3237_c0_g2~~TRINITY_DN3237_c0_g2_i1.p1  ORF type:complete len:297 (-),score=72.47 TRINITY_DN3237_c0_g2_i1:46-936(-)
MADLSARKSFPAMNKLAVDKLFKDIGEIKPSSPFELLPKLILIGEIFSYLNGKDILKIWTLNKYFLKLLCDNSNYTNQIWKRFLKNEGGLELEEIELDQYLKSFQKTAFETKMNRYCLLYKYSGFKIERIDENIFSHERISGGVKVKKLLNDEFNSILFSEVKRTITIKLELIENPNPNKYACILVGFHEPSKFALVGHTYTSGTYISEAKVGFYGKFKSSHQSEINFVEKGDYLYIKVDKENKKIFFKDQNGKTNTQPFEDTIFSDPNSPIHFSIMVWYINTTFTMRVVNEQINF